MSQTNIDDFERALEKLERVLAPTYQNEKEQIEILDIVQILFSLTLDANEVSCKWHEDERVHFQVGDGTSRPYAIKSAFRILLAAI